MRYLKLLVAKLRSLHVSPGRGHTMTNECPSEPKFFRQDEFAKDPSSVMRRADLDGSAVITDEEGNPRMRIGASIERQLIID